MRKLVIVIGKFIGYFIKFVLWILMEIYYFQQNLPKMMKNTWKIVCLFVKSKNPKNRIFYKIRSRRVQNGKFKVFQVREKPRRGKNFSNFKNLNT